MTATNTSDLPNYDQPAFGEPSVAFVPTAVGRVASEILVNSATASLQLSPTIATLTTGGFVIVWTDLSAGVGGAGGDASNTAIKAQLFTASGEMVGGEFLVNTATVGGQSNPIVTVLPGGRFVVVWNDESEGVGGAGGDASEWAIKAQIFTDQGAAVGGEFLVNTATSNYQDSHRVSVLPSGDFVITWNDYSAGVGGATGDSSGTAVKAQLFNSGGQAVGSEILVNTATLNSQNYPEITGLGDGGFVFTWQDFSMGVGGAAGDNSSWAVKAQAFDAAGDPVGTEILVNTATSDAQYAPRIIALSGSGFVITWTDFSKGVGGTPGDSSLFAVKAQLFTSAGVPVGAEILVNTVTDGGQFSPEMALLAGGGFVVTWLDDSNIGPDTLGYAVKAQVFNAAGVPVGGEIQVNTATHMDQSVQKVTALSNGGFVVVWQDESGGVGGANGDTSQSAAKAQVFSADGTPVGGEILVNTATALDQIGMRVTALPDGGFAVTWLDSSQGVGGATGDTSDTAIKAQVFNVGLSAVEQVGLDLKNSGLHVGHNDADAVLTVTLSTDYGVLTLTAGTSGALVAGSGTGVVTLTGTAAQIEALLNSDGTSTASFLADTDTPPTMTLFSVVVDDGFGGTASTSLLIAIEDTAEAPPGGTPADDVLVGTGGDDTIDGGEGNDTINGGGGADYLKGGLGADAMSGGTGDDTYVVDDAGDTTDETGGDGTDLVISRVSWTLAAAVENLTLGNGGTLSGTGNELANVITGNSVANTLNGLAGNDTLNGGGGDDVLNGGDDDDILDGGTQNDILNGGAGIDTLIGGAGHDTLDGGTGADGMTGGAGNDVYVVDDGGDVVTEAAGEGSDTVEASISYSLTANVETLVLTGAGDIDGTGNTLGNTLTGNAGANTLNGGDGGDILNGLAGADTLNGEAGDDTLDGGGDDDQLFGGAGQDRLTGGTGADTFAFTDADIRRTGLGLTSNKDQILDLSFAGGDRIDLSSIDANTTLDDDQAFSFVAGFTGVAGQAVMTFAGGKTTLKLDVDGDGIADLRVEINGDLRGTTGNLYTGGGDSDGGWVL